MSRPAWSFEVTDAVPVPALGLDVTAAWAYGDGRAGGVKVAVLDSGVDAEHPRVGPLAGAVSLDLIGDDVVATDGPHSDLYGHGTACAAIIRRLAPACELYSVRVLGERLTGKTQVFAEGIRWAIEHGIRVVNLSLSTANREWLGPLYEVCDRAAFANVVLCCALNNQHKASFPSQFSSVFSSAAIESADWESFAYNPNPPAEWGAPGIEVEVAWLGGATIVATGNSFAAPAIAGHAARVLGAHPDLTPFQVKAVLAELAARRQP